MFIFWNIKRSARSVENLLISFFESRKSKFIYNISYIIVYYDEKINNNKLKESIFHVHFYDLRRLLVAF